jgi:hypothetical protein
VHLQSNRISVSQDGLNPIFEYAAQGQCCERRMAWQDAVRWYERSLACLPNLFGADKQIRPLPLADGKTISFHPPHASRIYEALGRALMAMDRREDSILAYRAAQSLDPENHSAQRFLKANIDMTKTGETEQPGDAKAGPCAVPETSNHTIGKDLTLVMVTHCTGRLKKFETLSPPSNKLVAATYGSLLEVMGESVAACPKVMCYDHNPDGALRNKQYARSLEAFSIEHGFELCTFQGVGLFNILNRIVPTIKSPYILFVEHDWLFRGGRIQLPVIIEMMNNEPNINAMRFNKRENYLNGQDFLMSVDTAPRRYPLMRTASYSNNPSIIRTNKLKKQWLPICEKALRRVSDNLGGSAFGVEEILFKKYVGDIRVRGFQAAHALWGTHVFGRVGDPPRVTHLGE